jgi:hypothetical protein
MSAQRACPTRRGQIRLSTQSVLEATPTSGALETNGPPPGRRLLNLSMSEATAQRRSRRDETVCATFPRLTPVRNLQPRRRTRFFGFFVELLRAFVGCERLLVGTSERLSRIRSGSSKAALTMSCRPAMTGCFTIVMRFHRSRVTRTRNPKGVSTPNNSPGSGPPQHSRCRSDALRDHPRVAHFRSPNDSR